MITTEKIDEIIEKLDIVQVVSRYVALKKSGRNYKGLCPFHPEKTPSFIVSEEKQIFHCFGCNVGGNVINFLMRIENLSFSEAAAVAAEMAGIELSSDTLSQYTDIRKKKIIEANKIAMSFFREMLNSSYGNVAVGFLEKRNIPRDSWEKFGFGYSPAGNRFVQYLKEKNLSLSDFEQAGLIVKREGQYSDVFRHRVMLPIFDIRNNVLGFGGRSIDQEQQPKYLNSPENYVFKKGSIFYGFNWAKEKIKTTGFSIIVEGYFDLVKMHLSGFNNTLASLGTALTDSHLRTLKRWTNNILLVFDSDSAGSAAAYRSIESILAAGFQVKIGVMPSGFDPEDFLDNYGYDALKNLLNQSKDFIDFVYQVGSQKYSVDSIKGKAELAEEMIKLIKKIPDEIEKNLRIKEVARLFDIDEELLTKQVFLINEKHERQDVENLPVKHHPYASDIAEQTLVEILLRQPEWAKEIKEYTEYLTEDLKILVGCCIKGDTSPRNASKILNKIGNPVYAGHLTGAVLKEENVENIETTRKIFYDCLNQLGKQSYKRKRDELRQIIRQKQKNGETCESELEQLQFCIKKMSEKNLKPFTFRRNSDGKEE